MVCLVGTLSSLSIEDAYYSLLASPLTVLVILLCNNSKPPSLPDRTLLSAYKLTKAWGFDILETTQMPMGPDDAAIEFQSRSSNLRSENACSSE